MQTEFVGLEEIETAQILQPFDKDDVAVMTKWGNKIRKEGRDICLSRSAAQDRDTLSWMNAGLIVLQSRTLGVEILLTKAKAAEGIQRQGGMYQSFVGNYAKNQWGEGATFRSLETGLEIIANLCPSAKAPVPGPADTQIKTPGAYGRPLDVVLNKARAPKGPSKTAVGGKTVQLRN